MTWFVIGLAIGFFGLLAWINRAWVMEQIKSFKWIDK